MSNSHERDNPDALFAKLEHLGIDPMLRQFLALVKQVQEEIDDLGTADTDSVHIALKKINQEWEKCQLYEQGVLLTARARVSAGLTLDSLDLDWLSKSREPLNDTEGPYFELAGENMICLGFGVDVEPEEGEYPTRPRIVLTFTTKEQHIEMLDDGITRYDGCIRVYEEELYATDFEDPSIESITDYLKYHHAQILEQVDRKVTERPIGNRKLKATLVDFSLKLDAISLRDHLLLRYLERYIAHRLHFKEDMYEVVTADEFESVNEADKRISSVEPNSVKKVYAYVMGVKIVASAAEGEDMHRMQLILAVPQRDSEDKYEAFLARAETIQTIRNLQNSTRHFGASSMMQFDTPEEVRKHFARVGNEQHDRNFRSSQEQAYLDMEALEAYGDPQLDSIGRIVKYDAERKIFIILIEDDLAVVRSDFHELEAACGAKNLSDVEKVAAYREIGRQLRENAAEPVELRRGDVIEPIDQVVAIAIDKTTGMVSPFVCFGAKRFTGTYDGTTVTRLPDLVAAISLGEAGSYDYQLGVAMQDVSSVDASGAVDTATYKNKIIILPATGDLAPIIYKVIDANEQRL